MALKLLHKDGELSTGIFFVLYSNCQWNIFEFDSIFSFFLFLNSLEQQESEPVKQKRAERWFDKRFVLNALMTCGRGVSLLLCQV